MKKSISNFAVKAAVFAVIGLGTAALSAFAWTGPTQTAPGGNVSAPLNVGTSTQIKYGNLVLNGLSVNAATILSGLLQIPIGTPAPGDVLTSADASGTVEWEVASSDTGNSPVFINPITLATSNGTTAWTAISLAGDGVPSTASAIILGTEVAATDNTVDNIYMEPSSSGPVYQIGGSQSAGGGAPSLSSFNQSIYPITSSLSFYYKTSGAGTDGSTITLVGYVGPAPVGF
jgi:hypothetical protein